MLRRGPLKGRRKAAPPKVQVEPAPGGTAQPSANVARQPGRNGPLVDALGIVRVDPRTCPTLARKMEEVGRRIRAERTKWEQYQTSRDPQLLAELLGVEVPRAVVQERVEALPQEAVPLVEQLRKCKDKSEASKLRAQLRKLGHKGGLRGLSR